MFLNRLRTAASLLLLVTSACASDSVAPKPGKSEDNPPALPLTPSTPTTSDGTAYSIVLFRKDWSLPSFNAPIPVASVVQIAGMHQTIWAKVLTKSGAILENAHVTWTSSNPQAVPVAANGNCGPQAVCNRTSINALDNGTATVTATVDGVSASLAVAAYVDAPETDAVNPEFSVIELGSDGQDWGYAPKLSLTSRADLSVVAMRYTIPNAATTSLCGASRHIAPGQKLELFPEIYGDYALVDGRGTRATGPASLTVFVQDSNGGVFKVITSGAILPGGKPTTYTGVVIDEPWQVPC